MITCFRSFVITGFLLASVSIDASQQGPSLTYLATRATARGLYAQLNGHNWQFVDTHLRKSLPADLYEKVQEQFRQCYGRYARRDVHDPEEAREMFECSLFPQIEPGVENAINLYNDDTEDLMHTLVHDAPVQAAVISPDEQIVFSIADNTFHMWNASTGTLMKRLPENVDNADKIKVMTISSDNNIIVSGSLDGVICIWDAQTGRLMNAFTGHCSQVSALAISSDNKFIVSACYGDRMICLWDVHTGALKQTLVGPPDKILGVAISSDNMFIASFSGEYTDDEMICEWELQQSYEQALEDASLSIAQKQGEEGYRKFLQHKYRVELYYATVAVRQRALNLYQ